MSETELQAAIKTALEGMGVWVIRTAVSRKRGRGFTGEVGMPDLWTEYGWIEVKLPGNNLDPDQVTWHRKAERHHINVGVAMSVAQAVDHVQHWRKRKLPEVPRRFG